MTFTSPFALPPKPEPVDPYERYEGLWAAVWRGGPANMPKHCAHAVATRGSGRALCGKALPFDKQRAYARAEGHRRLYQIHYEPVGEPPNLTCVACRRKVADR